MNRRFFRVMAAICVLSVLVAHPGGSGTGPFSSVVQAKTSQELWKEVEKAEKDGLPQTAVDLLKRIVAVSRTEKQDDEYLRALTRQIILESVIQGNKPEYRVNRMIEELKEAPASAQPIMRLVLAQWYWRYFSRNKWRFMDRTQTQGLEDKDFTTWDLAKLFKEINSLYLDILKDEELLKKVSLSVYPNFLIQGNLPASVKPTLFDFAAFEALDFYTSGEQAAAQPEDAFVIQSDSAALAPAVDFLDFKPDTTDLESPKLQALKIYQKILSFHAKDQDPDAYLDADLERLRFFKNAAVGEGISDRYVERLKEITEKAPASELQSLAYYYWAQELYDRDDYVQAYELAGRGEVAHPTSLGADNCRTLRQRIAAHEYDLRAEAVIRPGLPGKIAVTYRNITGLYFRLIKEDFQALLKSPDAESLFWMSDEIVRKLIGRKPDVRWETPLKPTPDFKTRTVLVDIPALQPGFYRILASFTKDFAWENNKIQAESFWVSRLGLISAGLEGRLKGYIVRNDSGEPLSSVKVALYQWDHGHKALTEFESAATDGLGAFDLARDTSRSGSLIYAGDGKGNELCDTDFPDFYAQDREPSTQTLFFTDRSLYRPGQMIFFKGICLSVDQDQNNYKILPQQKVRVLFNDTDGQEVEILDLKTNDYGAFSGAFNAPSDRLTGEMTISTEDPRGSCAVQVEEYKRPKFQVKLEAPDREFRLNDRVELSGEATAYTGAPVDGASVKYRVVRRVQFPRWWYFWHGGSSEQSQEIGHGTLRTDESGKFKVEFQAKPDLSVSASSGPTFTYSVTVDVTDSAGETRSAESSVRLGYASLEAGLSCAAWQEQGRPIVIDVTTTTLNNVKIAAKGEVEIYSLKGPDKPVPADLIGELEVREKEAVQGQAQQGFSQTPDWRKWPAGPLTAKQAFETSDKEDSLCRLSFDLRRGVYKAKLKTKDKFGTAVESLLFFVVLDPALDKFDISVPFFSAARKSQVEVGQTFEAVWGTGYDQGPVLVEVFQNNRSLHRFWAPSMKTQGLFNVPVDEKLRGGFTVIFTMVKENRIYRDTMSVWVPWTNKMLDLKWQTFRSKLRPGQPETWSLKIEGQDAATRAAEMVAALYDESLDQFYGHAFPDFSGIFRLDLTWDQANFSDKSLDLKSYLETWNLSRSFTSRVYTHFPLEIIEDLYGYRYPGQVMYTVNGAEAPPAAARMEEAVTVVGASPLVDMKKRAMGGVAGGVAEDSGKGGVKTKLQPDLSKVEARKNLNETAFFFPHLLTDKDGVVTLEFKMPEALTEWRFLGFAHTKNLESGSIVDHAITQKDLMVQPNPPRFMREGDKLEFTVKVTNMSDKEAGGDVQLVFFDPQTEKSLDGLLSNTKPKLSFSIPARQSRSFAWPLVVADGLRVVGFKAVAATSEFSDGEESWLPVLSRRLVVRESIPLWISDKGEKKFTFEKLLGSGASATLQNLSLTVQMASNPAWYAVQALPFLMEFPYECSEQVFNRLYANALAQKIANSDPKIRRVFDLWKGTSALQSNLEKNEDLRSVLLQESPWVLEAKAESQAKRNIGLLFDENRMKEEIKSALSKLQNAQLEDGSWSWFPGGRGNDYITLYIVTGFGRMKHLGVASVQQDMAFKALKSLDGWIDEIYKAILKDKTAGHNHLSSIVALYLYGRSFYLKEMPIPASSREAVNYFLKQASRFWLELDCRQSQAHLALALNRFGDKVTAQKIMRSMKERSLTDEEMGRFWGESEPSWWWYRAPIETQAVMIEAFDEVMNDQKTVEECKIWLLKNKQTQDWKTTKATADAVYGLILKGANLLASDSIVEVSLAGEAVKPEKIEVGTGFYEKRFESSAVAPGMGNITVTKSDPGIAWGGVHWQYLEDISKITPHAQNPLKLKKNVFVQKLTKKGPVIEPMQGPLAVGDTLIVRIELRTDRDMEYVHMRDHRGSGLEPTNVLSQYKYQGGLVYYEATKDAATHFFIDYLPKGTYIFEYQLKVQLRGTYQNGTADIECMYAPEFNSHSESTKLEVK